MSLILTPTNPCNICIAEGTHTQECVTICKNRDMWKLQQCFAKAQAEFMMDQIIARIEAMDFTLSRPFIVNQLRKWSIEK